MCTVVLKFSIHNEQNDHFYLWLGDRSIVAAASGRCAGIWQLEESLVLRAWCGNICFSKQFPGISDVSALHTRLSPRWREMLLPAEKTHCINLLSFPPTLSFMAYLLLLTATRVTSYPHVPCFHCNQTPTNVRKAHEVLGEGFPKTSGQALQWRGFASRCQKAECRWHTASPNPQNDISVLLCFPGLPSPLLPSWHIYA